MELFSQDPLFGPLIATLGFGPFVFSIIFILITLWTILWKSLALWYAARNRQKIWFVALLLVNTVGLLEIAYLYWFREDRNGDGDGKLWGIPDKVKAPAAASSVPETKPEEK